MQLGGELLLRLRSFGDGGEEVFVFFFVSRYLLPCSYFGLGAMSGGRSVWLLLDIFSSPSHSILAVEVHGTRIRGASA